MTHVIPNLLTAAEIITIANDYQSAPVVWPDPIRDWVRREAKDLVLTTADAEDTTQLYKHAPQPDLDLWWGEDADILLTTCMDVVDGQPYDDANQMREFLAANGYLQISRDFNNPSWWDGDTNLLFRYAHDLHHCQTEDCNFVLDGEICAFTKFAAHIPQFIENQTDHWAAYPYSIISALYGLLWGEIVGQVCFLRTFGDYPEQKEVVHNSPADLAIIKRVLDAYQIPHLLGA